LSNKGITKKIPALIGSKQGFLTNQKKTDVKMKPD